MRLKLNELLHDLIHERDKSEEAKGKKEKKIIELDKEIEAASREIKWKMNCLSAEAKERMKRKK